MSIIDITGSAAVREVESIQPDSRSVVVHVERRKSGWRGWLLIGASKRHGPVEREVVRGKTRSAVLADLLDLLLAHDIDIEPCCVDAP